MSNPLLSRFLFVYGTLRFSQNTGMSKWLQSTGTHCVSTTATTAGEVKNLGSFPGAKFYNDSVYDKTMPLITGELLVMPDDEKARAAIMERLDYYEGVASGMYKRVIVDVKIPGHDFSIETFAYEYMNY